MGIGMWGESIPLQKRWETVKWNTKILDVRQCNKKNARSKKYFQVELFNVASSVRCSKRHICNDRWKSNRKAVQWNAKYIV